MFPSEEQGLIYNFWVVALENILVLTSLQDMRNLFQNSGVFLSEEPSWIFISGLQKMFRFLSST